MTSPYDDYLRDQAMEDACGRRVRAWDDPGDQDAEYDDPYTTTLPWDADPEVDPITALQQATHGYNLEAELGEERAGWGGGGTLAVRQRVMAELKASGIHAPGRVPRTLYEAEAILGIYGGPGIRDHEALIRLLYKVLRIKQRFIVEDDFGAQDITQPAATHAGRITMYDIGLVVQGLQQITKTGLTIKMRAIRARLVQMRVALTILLNQFRQAAYLDGLRAWLNTADTLADVPQPIYVKPRPPTAPLAPPV